LHQGACMPGETDAWSRAGAEVVDVLRAGGGVPTEIRKCSGQGRRV